MIVSVPIASDDLGEIGIDVLERGVDAREGLVQQIAVGLLVERLLDLGRSAMAKP